MKLAWLTDIHLNFLDSSERKHFYNEIEKTHCDSVLISGDIAEAPSLVSILSEMADQIKKPTYFVLGNHDYYRGQVSNVREAARELTKTHERLFWLPASGPQLLAKNTILLGQDGWADGRLGDYQNSRVVLNDSRMIVDLFQESILGKSHLLKKMQELADADALQLQGNLLQAIKQNPKRIIVLTHVPPFKEASQYNGRISDDDWLPYFTSKIMGDVLMQAAEENPSIEFLVLGGHTHGKANYQALNNLNIRIGKAEYGEPEVQDLITL